MGTSRKKGWGSHCHANWFLVQTPMSCKERLKGKVRYKRFWHHLLSEVGVVSFFEGCCRQGALVSLIFVCNLFKFVYISGACGVYSVSGQAIFTPPESGLLCTVVSAPGQDVTETMVAA